MKYTTVARVARCRNVRNCYNICNIVTYSEPQTIPADRGRGGLPEAGRAGVSSHKFFYFFYFLLFNQGAAFCCLLKHRCYISAQNFYSFLHFL